MTREAIEEAKERFLKDVANHKMEIKLDQGLYRHLSFRDKDRGSVYHFDVVTYPGFLVISGDMHCYVFSRIQDMFEFFRQDELRVNPGYWGEKCEAADTQGGIERYSSDKFIDAVKDYLKGFDDKPEGLEEDVRNNVLSAAHSEWEAMSAIQEYRYEDFYFQDFWEYNLKDYDYAYIWCLHAIVWGIQQYDAGKKDG